MKLLFLLVFIGTMTLQAETPPSESSPPPPSDAAVDAHSTIKAAAIDPFQDPFIATLHARHQKAVEGDKKEVKLLVSDLEKLTAENPQNSLLLAYLGSTYTLQSRDAFPGPTKLELLKKGGKTLDQAVNQDPYNIATRFIRAVNYYELPRIFNKRNISREDFQIIVTQMESPGSPCYFSDETRQAIYYYSGFSYQQLKQPEQSKILWQKGIQISPFSSLGQKMQHELKKLK